MFKTLLIVIAAFMVIASFFANAASVNISKNNLKITSIDYAELPTWTIGNYWKYDMDFIFVVRDGAAKTFSVNAVIEDMYAALTDVQTIAGKEVYVLSVDGDISGTLSLFNAEIDIADFAGDFGGYAHIDKNTLGIKKFIFEVDGQVNVPILGSRSMYFEMTLDFNENFNFFDFPINSNEGPWDVHIDNASLSAHADIDVPFGKTDYFSSMVFNDVISISGIDSVTVPAGTFESFKIGGTWGHQSELWYAPDAGYLVKVDEAILWEDGYIESVFHLNLVDTNYAVGNEPPNAPNKPSGQNNGEAEKTYAYTTSTIDPNQDNIYYLFDWGDGKTSGWLGPFGSGAQVSASHMWYNKGVYNVVAKAKDESGLQSSWSEPLSIGIQGDPKINFFVYHVNQIDYIDVDDPISIWVDESLPEWFYEVAAISDGTSSPPQMHENKKNGEWVSNKTWDPQKNHVFIGYSRYVTINVKLMDHDDRWEDPINGKDDLADVSGCSGGGMDNDISFLRAAIYHGTYDLVTNQLKSYQTGAANENADYVYKQNGYYITSGENKPDNSEGKDENDATVWFELTNDYIPPQAKIQLMDENQRIKPKTPVQFAGVVQDGAPDYSWSWDFGDGSTINVQNPTHIFTESKMYTVKLTVTDGFEQQSIYSLNINVENTNPILTNDNLEWTGKGTTDDTFTFKVHYLDSDEDSPSVKTVVVDGESKTLQGSGSNSDYSIAFLGSEIGKGSHKYYFYFEDGFGGTAKTSEKTFSVTKQKSLNVFLRVEELFSFFKVIKNRFYL
jgi:hypothetical protein